MSSAVLVAIRIKAAPQVVFDAFVADIGLWWRPSALFAITPRGDGALRFEPGPAGRLVTDLPNGKTFEIGRITKWSPPESLAFSWRQGTFAPDQTTEVEVTFVPVDGETRVTVTHRGWNTIPGTSAARHGFALPLFQKRLAEAWRMRLAALTDHLAQPSPIE